MRDPGLGTEHPPGVTLAPGPGAKRPQIRPGFRLGKHRRGNDPARGDAGKQSLLLVIRAVRQDQLGGNLGTGCQRPGADPATRQGLGHHTHRDLAHAGTAPRLGRGQAKHAQIAELFQQWQGDQFVPHVPTMGMRRYLFVGKGMKLVADRLQGLIQPAGLQRRPAPGRIQQLNDPRFHGLGRPAPQATNHMAQPVSRRKDIGRAEHLALVHRQPAGQLAQILVRQQLRRQSLSFPEIVPQLARPDRRLPQGFGVSCGPGEAMGGVLFGIKRDTIQPPVALNPTQHGGLERRHQRAGLARGGVQQVRKVWQDQTHGPTIGTLRCVRSLLKWCSTSDFRKRATC